MNMQLNEFCKKYSDDLSASIKAAAWGFLQDTIDLIQRTVACQKKVIVVGNGGSAAIASHIAIDLTHAANIRCISFNESSTITCFANDYGYEQWVVKALESYGDYGDLVILISSSGRSKNMLLAAEYAKKNNMQVVTFTGFDKNNPLSSAGEINFWVDSKSYNIVEMTHHVWLCMLVDYLQNTANSAETQGK